MYEFHPSVSGIEGNRKLTVKILFVSLFLPEIQGTSAGTRTAGELLKILSEKYEVYLATRVEDSHIHKVKEIRHFCNEIYLFPYPAVMKRNWFELLKLIISYVVFGYKVNRIISSNDFKLIHVEWVESGILLKKKNIPMVLDAHDVITKVAERWFRTSKGINALIQYMRYLFVRSLERYVARKFDKILTRSEYDRNYLHRMDSHLNVDVLPHPAGLDFMGRDVQRDDKSLLFLGSFKHHVSNIKAVLYFYSEILPLIKLKIPDVKFYIVGYGPTKEICEIAERDKNVIVTGFVEDIEYYYKRAMVFVASMLTGGGLLVKVIDAMAAGTPVVSTSIGNEGVGGIDNVHLLIADDPVDFANKVVSLLSDENLWLRLSNEGQAFVSERFSLGTMRDVLNRTYSEISMGGSRR